MAYQKETKRRKISKQRVLILCEGKTDSQRWDKLNQHYKTAKARAWAIRVKEGIELPNCKPYSNMDELIERIKDIAK